MVQVLGILIALAGLSVLLYTLERLFPSVLGQQWWRRGCDVDVLYWLFTPLVTRTVLKIVGVAGVVIVLGALGRQVGPRISEGFGPVVWQPLWLLLIEMLVLGDLIGYWTHRWFHRSRQWKLHAVHHSSTQLDWLSTVRVHPVNDVVSKLVPALILVCLGFPLKALAGYVPLLTFYACLVHANVDWSFGPLRCVIASPLFHRWHHTTEEQGLNKNFAPLFPFVDLMFGTFYMPSGQRPERFGTSGTQVPETFLGQLLFPFRSDSAGGHNSIAKPSLDAVVAKCLVGAETRKVQAFIDTLNTPGWTQPADRLRVDRDKDAQKLAREPVAADHDQG
jgi:sterol desaturase/sphingolipid hydroxylase (fatty acid hydroxylase superfamily)